MDNEAKACLDDIALKLQSSSDAKVAIVGNEASTEKHADKNAGRARRTTRRSTWSPTRASMPSRITIYTGTTDAKTATTTLIPAGANFDSTGDTPVDEAALKAKPVAQAPQEEVNNRNRRHTG